jgi:hypothetical protein
LKVALNTINPNPTFCYLLDINPIFLSLTILQPGRRGTSEEMEDYVLESNNLTLLTSVIPCMINHPDYIQIMRENWNIDINGSITFFI